MKKITKFLTIVVLMQTVFTMDPWKRTQKFFDSYNNTSKSSINVNTNMASRNNALDKDYQYLLSLLKNADKKTNNYDKNVSEIISSWSKSPNSMNTFSNVISVINNAQKY